jgi:hypothetical protein
MGVDESGDCSPAVEIDLPAAGGPELQDVDVRTDGDDALAGDRDRPGARLPGVHCQEIAVVEDEVRRLPQDLGQRRPAQQRKRQQASSAPQQLPP